MGNVDFIEKEFEMKKIDILLDRSILGVIKEIVRDYNEFCNMKEELKTYSLIYLINNETNIFKLIDIYEDCDYHLIQLKTGRKSPSIYLELNSGSVFCKYSHFSESILKEILGIFKFRLEKTIEFNRLYLLYLDKYMSRDKVLDFIYKYPYIKFSHEYFDDDEFLYSDGKNKVYDENNYLFEDEETFDHRYSGLRIRQGSCWEENWKIIGIYKRDLAWGKLRESREDC